MKIKLLSGLIILLFTFQLEAQINKESNAKKVVYHYYHDGIADENSDISFIYSNEIVYLSKPDSRIKYYIDYHKNENVTVIEYDNELFCNTVSFDSLPKPNMLPEEDSILGFNCKLASYSVFSNKIDVWYTEDSDIKGSPYRRYLPTDEALVLKVVINGNRTLIADSIIDLIDFDSQKYSYTDPKYITDPELEELKIKSRYTTITVFKDEIINFDPDYWKNNTFDSATSVHHFSKGAIIVKEINLPESVKNGDNIFVNLECNSEGDAYDRTGSVFVINQRENTISMINAFKDGLEVLPKYYDNNGTDYQGIIASSQYEPPIEIMRFFTSFGVNHFNSLRPINNYNWEQTAAYKQDVTSVFPIDSDKMYIGVFIGNYDKGGHRVSLDLDIYPSFDDSQETQKYIQPIFNTVNIMEMSSQEYGRLFNNDSLSGYFTIPDSIDALNLVYTTTGHGGWGGGDEFNPKLNQIYIDGKLVFSITPWRTDCATYRLYNPASGNFGNGLSSSDLSRSNWCPATLTPPYFINLDTLKPGLHNYEIVIDQGEDSGGSFNHWSVSGILVGHIKK